MVRRAVLLALLAALGVGAASLAQGEAAVEATKLIGRVGPGFSISLQDENGAPLTSLAAGAYTITVHDASEEHSFHFIGPGVDRMTEVDFIGTVTWEITVTDGVYSIQCDAHPTTMRRRVTGGNATLPTTTTTAPAPAPAPKLNGAVGPGFTISLRNAAGRAVRTLKPGPYAVTVRDRSTSHNFHLTGAGVNRRTGVPFVGTVTWKVRFTRGTLRFLCDPHASSLRGSVRVG